MFTANNLPVSAAEWHSSCGFCCLHMKTQQYFAIVGGQMWKHNTKKLKN